MATTHSGVSERWLDDYLDLYNYALQIRDEQWQADILHALREKENVNAGDETEHLKLALWARFVSISQEVLSLYEAMRLSKDAKLQRSLLEKAWSLKIERIQIGRQIHSLKEKTDI